MFYPGGSLRKKGAFSLGKKVGLCKTFSKSGDLHLTEVGIMDVCLDLKLLNFISKPSK